MRKNLGLEQRSACAALWLVMSFPGMGKVRWFRFAGQQGTQRDPEFRTGNAHGTTQVEDCLKVFGCVRLRFRGEI